MAAPIRPHLKAWKRKFVFQIYDLARSGMSNTKIAEVIGVTPITFRRWVENRPLVEMALDLARTTSDGSSGAETFADYVYKQLPPKLQVVWDQRKQTLQEPNGLVRWKKLVESQGVKAQQYLFLYAMVKSSFNQSEACRKLGISKKKELDHWIATDPDFARLVDEIEWHKGNFFESSLVNLVKQGDPNAVLFVNKTFNKKRGYGGESDTTITHNHTHSIISIDAILPRLSLEVRKAILSTWKEYCEEVDSGNNVRFIQPEAISNE